MSYCQGYKGIKGVRGRVGDPGPDVSLYHYLTSYLYLYDLDSSYDLLFKLPAF